jgi:hypothetical protein
MNDAQVPLQKELLDWQAPGIDLGVRYELPHIKASVELSIPMSPPLPACNMKDTLHTPIFVDRDQHFEAQMQSIARKVLEDGGRVGWMIHPLLLQTRQLFPLMKAG